MLRHREMHVAAAERHQDVGHAFRDGGPAADRQPVVGSLRGRRHQVLLVELPRPHQDGTGDRLGLVERERAQHVAGSVPEVRDLLGESRLGAVLHDAREATEHAVEEVDLARPEMAVLAHQDVGDEGQAARAADARAALDRALDVSQESIDLAHREA